MSGHTYFASQQNKRFIFSRMTMYRNNSPWLYSIQATDGAASTEPCSDTSFSNFSSITFIPQLSIVNYQFSIIKNAGPAGYFRNYTPHPLCFHYFRPRHYFLSQTFYHSATKSAPRNRNRHLLRLQHHTNDAYRLLHARSLQPWQPHSPQWVSKYSPS